MYDKAQAAVTQRQGPDVVRSSTSGPGSQNSKPSASEMYRQAMANVSTNRNQPSSPRMMPDPSQRQPTATSPQNRQYLTAEQEKAALKRYEEARSAVDRLQSLPVAYDSLYPKIGGASSSVSSPDAPPSFEASVSSVAVAVGPMTAAQEKAALAERMRAADNQHSTQVTTLPPSFSHTAISPPASTSGNPLPKKEFMEAAAEKEAMRKKLEARDASRKKSSGMATSRNASFTTGTRPAPTPPPMSALTSNATAVMSAAEEKALLKAKLEAKASKREPFTHLQQAPQPYSPGMMSVTLSATEAPPPLMPRPPAAYIQETREEDERVSKIAIDGANLRFDTDGSEGSGVYTNGHVQGQGQSRVLKVSGPPPPLPPKPAGG